MYCDLVFWFDVCFLLFLTGIQWLSCLVQWMHAVLFPLCLLFYPSYGFLLNFSRCLVSIACGHFLL